MSYYQHHEGGYYEFLHCARIKSNNQRVVVYRSCKDNSIWVRTEFDFFEKFKPVPESEVTAT